MILSCARRFANTIVRADATILPEYLEDEPMSNGIAVNAVRTGRPIAVAVCLSVLWLSGCATRNSGVVSTGTGSYKVARSAAGGFTHPGTLTESAKQAADDYCTKQGGIAVISSVQETPPPYWFGHYPTAEVGFSCRTTGTASAAPPAMNTPPQPSG